MPNKVVRWIRSGVQACMSCILPPKSSVQPPEKKKRKKRRFWMIRRTNKIGVVVPTVPDTKKKASKSKSDAKKGGTKETTDSNAKSSTKTAPKRKARVNPNCKDCINKVHSPRKMKVRLSAKIQARRDQDILDTRNTVAEERKESNEVETCKKESGKLHVIDLDADTVGGPSCILKGDTDNIQNGHDDDDDDIVCGEQGTSHDDNDDIVCGSANMSVEKKQVVESRKVEVENPIEHDDNADIVCSTPDTDHDDDDDIVCERADMRVEKKQVMEYKPRKDKVEKPMEHDDDDDDDDGHDDDIVCGNTDTGHDDDDDIVCWRADKSVEMKQVVEYDTKKDDIENQLEHDDGQRDGDTSEDDKDHDEDNAHDDENDHDDDDDIVIGTASQCTYPLRTEAVSQKQVNEVGSPTLSEIYDAGSSDSELDLVSSSTSASESDKEDSNSGLEMSKSFKQDGSSKNGTASDVHDDNDDVVCSDQPANSKVQTMEYKQERDGKPEGDSEGHEDAEYTICGGHSEDSDRVLDFQDTKESKLKEKDVSGQGSTSLDKFPTPPRTYSPGKSSYADLILNLASVIGDMKSSTSSSYESRAKLFGELLGGMKNANKSETKKTDQLQVKEEDASQKMSGDMNVHSSDDRATSSEVPQSPLVGEGPDDQIIWYKPPPCPKKSKKKASATKDTSKDPSQTKSNQKFTNVPVDPLDDIDQLLDEASKLF